ncbi:hypothetical protein BTM_1771 [Burkholderia thailandensis 34]|uniref:hypothetical protein n=1 Tax=Burkholderia thailandensis TaxID=57975 RepID=UPI0005D81C98|nr:hypothetical protein [Burkholderia thailandensis]AJY28313.1 hypothetical protein BTM_1771 [Burkholderia thailandensis 34]
MATTLEKLERVAGTSPVLTIPQLIEALGEALNLRDEWSVQSVRNQIARGTFPFPSGKIGKNRVFSVAVVAEIIDGMGRGEPAPPRDEPLPVQVRQVRAGKVVSVGGRPTNAARAERLRKLGVAYTQLFITALDAWWAEQVRLRQARDAAMLGDEADQAIDGPLPVYQRKRLGKPDAE